MAASNFKLDNLFAIIDKNNFQQTGSNEDIMNTDDLIKNGQVLDGKLTVWMVIISSPYLIILIQKKF